MGWASPASAVRADLSLDVRDMGGSKFDVRCSMFDVHQKASRKARKSRKGLKVGTADSADGADEERDCQGGANVWSAAASAARRRFRGRGTKPNGVP